MFDFFRDLFSYSDFAPRAQCEGWTRGLILLHNFSDLMIWMAYLTIPSLLIYFVSRRRQVPFPFIFWMFGAFIVSCGFTHFMDFLTFTYPMYRLEGLIKLVTALLSMATVFALFPVLPRALSLRTSDEVEREIAERKRAEQQREESSEFTRQIIANAREGIVVFDRLLHCVLWNPVMEELSGLPATAVLGKHPLELGGFFQDQETDALMESALAGQVLLCRDVSYSIPDTGKTGWCSPQLAPLRDAQRTIIGVIATVRDVTERKQAEQAVSQMRDELELRVEERTVELALANVELRESEERFQQLAEHIPQVFWITDPQGKELLYISPAFQTVWGRTSQFAYEQPMAFLETIHPDDQPALVESFQRRARGEATTNDYRIVRPDGSTRWIWDRGFPIESFDGDVYRVVGIAEDVTERKQAERDLQQAKEAAEAASRAKSDFLANVSHEIRTPLNGILGMTELVLDTELSAKQREYLRLAAQSAQSLLTVINDLLDFAKIEARKLDLVRERFTLRSTLNDTLGALTLRAQKKGLALSCTVQPDVPDQLLGDPYRLCQVIVNLIGNAVKFTEVGSVALSVTVDKAVESTVQLHFAVQDTGIGIPPEKQLSIFQPFEQGDASPTRKFEGTGLGLAIASQLIGLMGGRIWLESTVGEGSTFHFLAEFARAPQAGTALVTAPSGLSAPPKRVSRPLHVLVAEDNPINRLFAVDVLEKRGHVVLVADNGQEALDVLKTETVDVLLLDLQMPGMSGFEVAAIIRQQEKAKDRRLPILAVTAHAMKSDRDRCLAADMDDYLAKPMAAADLTTAIERVVSAAERVAPRPVHAALPTKLRAKMASVFLGVYPQWLATIRAALAQGDAAGVAATAHTLKGSVSHFDAPTAESAARLEHLAVTRELAAAATALGDLEEALQRLQPTLIAWMEQGKETSV
jgi:PAS domain S-box-containing protein